jgi:hypothetical protein
MALSRLAMWYQILAPEPAKTKKNVTPAFDHLIGGGSVFGDLTILCDFWFDEDLLLSVQFGKSLLLLVVVQKDYVPQRGMV